MTTTATTILAQLGGSKFVAMTGAKNLVDRGNGLSFDIGSGAKNKANKVCVTLTESDDYLVQFFRFSRKTLDCPEVYCASGVYADSLQSVFTNRTGLFCSL